MPGGTRLVLKETAPRGVSPVSRVPPRLFFPLTINRTTGDCGSRKYLRNVN